MTETAERVAVACPACSPRLETVHEVLAPGGGQATVRCTECDHVHKTTVEEPETRAVDVVVSQDGESFPATVEVPAEETIAVGEEFIVETDAAILTARITSLELDGDRRVKSAPARALETIWSRDVGNVAVNATIHPASGAREETRSETLQVPGDFEFVVGETETLSGEEFTVEGIYLREDATGYDFEKLDHEGDSALAKDVQRLYVRDEDSVAWSAW